VHRWWLTGCPLLEPPPGVVEGGWRRLTTWEDLLRELARDQGWPALYPENTEGGFHGLPVANKVRVGTTEAGPRVPAGD